MNVWVGAELEFAVCNSFGDALPFRHWFAHLEGLLKKLGVYFELGPNQAEICTEVSRCGGVGLISSIIERINIIKALLGDKGYLSTEQYFPQFAVTGSDLLNDPTLSPRHKAILRALQIEDPSKWERVGNLGGAQSVHFHGSIHNAEGTAWSFDPREATEASEYVNTLVNYLNAIAPYYACAVAERYGMPDPTPRIRLWFEYCRPWRAPQYAWHTRESRITWFENLPRLIGLRDGTSGDHESDWEVLPRCGSEPWNIHDAGVNRDLVRLSPPRSDKPWTIESRVNSMLRKVKQDADENIAIKVAEVADEHIAIMEAVYVHVTRGGGVDDVSGLFEAMHKEFPFLPSARPTRREWLWQLGLE